MRSKYFIDADNDESRVPLAKTSEDRADRVWSWPCLARPFGSWSTLEYVTERNAREAQLRGKQEVRMPYHSNIERCHMVEAHRPRHAFAMN